MSGVMQLHGGQGAASTDGVSHMFQAWQMVIAVNAQLPAEGDPARLYCCRTGMDQAVAGLRELANPVLVKSGRTAIRLALLVGKRREHESVTHRLAMQNR